MADDKAKSAQRSMDARWGSALAAGWTGIPNIILDKQSALRLTPLDLNVLLHILRHRWEEKKRPWVAKGSIARSIGRAPRSIQRSLARMEKRGILQRRYRGDGPFGHRPSEFELAGILVKATDYGQKHMRKNPKTAPPEKPKLTAIKGGA